VITPTPGLRQLVADMWIAGPKLLAIVQGYVLTPRRPRCRRHNRISPLFQHQLGCIADVGAGPQGICGRHEAQILVVDVLSLGHPLHDIGYVDIVSSKFRWAGRPDPVPRHEMVIQGLQVGGYTLVVEHLSRVHGCFCPLPQRFPRTLPQILVL